MNNSFNKKLAEILGKMDEKVLQAKLNAALDMIKKGDTENLIKKLNNMDKDELMKKIDELDEAQIKNLNFDREEVKKALENTDVEKLKGMLGEHGDEIMKKIYDIIG